MTKAKYTFEIYGRILFLQDVGKTEMSLTNDIEAVLQEVAVSLPNELNSYLVIYRDSSGDIDGIDIEDNKFFDFYGIHEMQFSRAIQKESFRIRERKLFKY